jgi:hypothetical protein
MKHIYTGTLSVIVWLGPSDRHSSIYIGLVNDVTLTEDRPLRLKIIKRALQNKAYSFEAAINYSGERLDDLFCLGVGFRLH